MKYRVEYLSTFYADIVSFEKVLEEYPQMARRILQKMDTKLSYLCEHPLMYPIYEDFPNFRKIVIEDYLLFYSINEHTKVIEVHRLIYGVTDVVRRLGD